MLEQIKKLDLNLSQINDAIEVANNYYSSLLSLVDKKLTVMDLNEEVISNWILLLDLREVQSDLNLLQMVRDYLKLTKEKEGN